MCSCMDLRAKGVKGRLGVFLCVRVLACVLFCVCGFCVRVFIFSLDLFAGMLVIDLRLKFGRITLVIK
jgi:hypothetical protein